MHLQNVFIVNPTTISMLSSVFLLFLTTYFNTFDIFDETTFSMSL